MSNGASIIAVEVLKEVSFCAPLVLGRKEVLREGIHTDPVKVNKLAAQKWCLQMLHQRVLSCQSLRKILL